MTQVADPAHKWVYRNFPRTGRCEHCGSTKKKTQWASIGHTYTRNRADWLELCTPCHKTLDNQPGAPTHQREKTHCKRGHPFDEANTYVRNGSRPGRDCRACARERKRKSA